MKKLQRIWLGILILGLSSGAAEAGPIVAGQDLVPSVAVQSVELFAGTPFNPGSSSFTVQLTANGSFILDRATQTGSTISFTVPIASFSGVLPGPLPPLSFDLLAGAPGLNPSQGTITNVVQNPADPGFAAGSPSSFVSGHFSADTFFELVIPGVGTIYSDPNQAAVFTADITGLPLPVGTVLASPERINLYFQTGPGFDPSRDPIIGQSFDRTVIVVPEPSTAALLLAGTAVLGVRRWRGRRGAPGAAAP